MVLTSYTLTYRQIHKHFRSAISKILYDFISYYEGPDLNFLKTIEKCSQKQPKTTLKKIILLNKKDL